NLNPLPVNFHAGPAGTDDYTDWVYQRNDPYLTNNWVVTNKGTKNNGYRGDVVISWLKLLDESFDGTAYTNEVYLMVVNGLTGQPHRHINCLLPLQLPCRGCFASQLPNAIQRPSHLRRHPPHIYARQRPNQ